VYIGDLSNFELCELCGSQCSGLLRRFDRIEPSDARGVISVTERQSTILRVRELAKACCGAWLATEGGGAG
jgi:glycyl-tRNA synthetase alpha subunit